MVEQFFDRSDELEYLEENYRKEKFSFIVIYGRRRVGKTFLVRKFLEDKERSLYFYVSEMSPQSLRGKLAEELYRRFNLRLSFNPTWDEIFRGIFRLSRREKHIVVFDEFQRLLEIDRGALSILQRIIDEEAHGCQLMLICTGSSIGMMERIYNYGQPLYGRATGFLKIKPFDFQATYRYLAMRLGVSPVNAVAIYGVFGGTPYYLSMLSSGDWLREAERLIFDYRSPLYLEPELLLKTELREHVTYFEILRLLASGKSTFSEIAGSLGASKTSLSYYLNVLIRDLDLVARDEPIGGGRAVYRIKDNFFRFWFRYVFPNRSMLELGERGEVLEKVREDFNTYMGLVFQDIARQQVWRLSLPFKPYRVGGWWRKGVEIDVVAVDRSGRKAILMEVKWRDIGLNEAERILFELEDKGKYLGYPVKYYGLIARRIEDKERLLKSGYLAFSIDDLVSG